MTTFAPELQRVLQQVCLVPLKKQGIMTKETPKRQLGLSATFVCLASAFCVCLIASNIFEPRLWQVGKLPFQLTGGVVIFPVSYIINDCLTEVYGYKKARFVIWLGFALCAFITVVSLLVTMLPRPIYEDNYAAADAFNMLFTQVPRVMIGSLLAFISGSTVNAWVMSVMKVASKGKRFGWRAILSSVAGEMVDSLIFFPIAFGGLLPLKGLIGLMVTQVIVKTAYEIIVLPATSLVVKRVKKHEELDVFDNGISYNPFKVNDID